jgi:hypothetical protein
VVRDLNLHHPLWGGEGDSRQDSDANKLLQLIGDHEMELLLPLGSITFDGLHRQATIDLSFGTPWVQERKVYCGVREDLDH